MEEESSHLGYSVEALLLLQKSLLEKQWSLSFERKRQTTTTKKIPVICSGVSARQRRISARKKTLCKNGGTTSAAARHVRSELLQNRLKGYVKGVISEELLTHAEVVHLSKKIKIGLSLDDHKSRYYIFLSFQCFDFGFWFLVFSF